MSILTTVNVLTKSAREAVDQHLRYYAHREAAPQNRDLFKDTDGQYFLNYLDTLFQDDGGIYKRGLVQHKKQIEAKLVAFSDRPPILSKYLWTANYHNYFCDFFSSVDVSAKVDVSAFALRPTRIVEDAGIAQRD